MSKVSSALKDAQSAMSILKDPFSNSCVTKVMTYAFKNIFNDEWKYTGDIEFKNGQTQGKQKFTGRDMADVIHQMEAFLATLGE